MNYCTHIFLGRQKILDVRLKCHNEDTGCTWIGPLSALEDHTQSCKFAIIACPNRCEADDSGSVLHLLRKDMAEHLKVKCPNRLNTCKLCKRTGSYLYIMKDHDQVCDKKVVPCPRSKSGCPEKMQRDKIKLHLKLQCDYVEHTCEFESIGCLARMSRRGVGRHLREAREKHIDLAMDALSLREKQHKTLTQGKAFVFKIPGYCDKKAKNEIFYSQAFYTHTDGYKMCIRVDLSSDGDARGKHLSIFTLMLQGQNDVKLRWPFRGSVKYELLNQLEDDNHYTKVSRFTETDKLDVANMKGYPKFLPHVLLNHDFIKKTQYLKDDTLYFRVSVKVDNLTPWLVRQNKIQLESIQTNKDFEMLKTGEPVVFAVTAYYARRTGNEWFFSAPFYTGPGGYRLCINVVPNGSGSGEGTHVSVYARQLEGSYDATLPRVTEGSITFTLLNQLADANHYSETLEGNRLEKCFGKAWGFSRFIPHSGLYPDLTRNIQYLQDDTLYFRVTIDLDYHKPWLASTHQF